jgi:hypothetical protein
MVALFAVAGVGGAAVVAGLGIAVGLLFGGPAGPVSLRALGAGAEVLAAVGVTVGAGGVFGVLLPTRIATRDRRALRQTTESRGGCGRTLAGLGGFGVVLLLLVPVLVAFHLPDLSRGGIGGTAWFALAVPFSWAWAGLVLGVGALAGGRLAAVREERLVAELTRSED